MIIKILLLFCMSIFISCGNTNCKSDLKIDEKQIGIQIDISNIYGVWTNGLTENASFRIDKDSIFYVDSFQTYKYLIKDDSLIIRGNEYDGQYKILKLTKDSLILSIENHKIEFWRFND